MFLTANKNYETIFILAPYNSKDQRKLKMFLSFKDTFSFSLTHTHVKASK